MKKQVSPVVTVVVIVAAVGIAVGLWFWQPFKPKVYGLEPPTAAQRQKQYEDMKNSMIEAAQARRQPH
jgi:hypothetical protein